MNNVILLMGPSGSGKSTLEKNLKNNHNYKNVISATTRQPRKGEIHGEDYYFLNKDEFFDWDMAEHDFFANNYYGVPMKELETKDDLVISMEPNGVKNIQKVIKERLPDKNVFIIYLNIDRNLLIENMKKRGDSMEMIQKRLSSDDINERVINNNLEIDFEFNKLRDDFDLLIIDKIKKEG